MSGVSFFLVYQNPSNGTKCGNFFEYIHKSFFTYGYSTTCTENSQLYARTVLILMNHETDHNVTFNSPSVDFFW